MIKTIRSKTHTTKSIQLAIIQAFIALWEIKIEQMVAIWNLMSEDEDRLKFIKISIIKILNVQLSKPLTSPISNNCWKTNLFNSLISNQSFKYDLMFL